MERATALLVYILFKLFSILRVWEIVHIKERANMKITVLEILEYCKQFNKMASEPKNLNRSDDII